MAGVPTTAIQGPKGNMKITGILIDLVYKVTSNVGGHEGELVFSDYEAIEGIKMANTIDITSPMGAFTMITNKTVINGKVDEQIFAKPAK